MPDFNRNADAQGHVGDAVDADDPLAIDLLENNMVVGGRAGDEMLPVFDRSEVEGLVGLVDRGINERSSRERQIGSCDDVFAAGP
jgi:hypothetical protein